MRTIPASELIINDDGSIFHLHLRPEQLADTVILVGDPGRVALVAEHFDNRECEVYYHLPWKRLQGRWTCRVRSRYSCH